MKSIRNGYGTIKTAP